MGSVLAQNLILLASVVVGMITLVYLIKYVKATKGIEKAANEQTEGLSKPIVTAAFTRVVRADGTGILRLNNVGNGPALSVSYTLIEERGACEFLRLKCGKLADIKAGEEKEMWDSFPLPNGTPAGYKVRCTYRGVSGAEYQSTICMSPNGTPLKFSERKENGSTTL